MEVSPSRRFNFGFLIRMIEQLTQYLRDTRGELQHVSWPTKRQALLFTVLVIVISVVVALALGLADFLFSRALNWFIGS